MRVLSCHDIKKLTLTHRRSGSFPEQINKMNERSVTERQTYRLSMQ